MWFSLFSVLARLLMMASELRFFSKITGTWDGSGEVDAMGLSGGFGFFLLELWGSAQPFLCCCIHSAKPTPRQTDAWPWAICCQLLKPLHIRVCRSEEPLCPSPHVFAPYAGPALALPRLPELPPAQQKHHRNTLHAGNRTKFAIKINEILFSYSREASMAHLKLWNLINFPYLYSGQRTKIHFTSLNLFTLT